MNRLKKFSFSKMIIHIILLLGSVMMLLPFAWMISTAFKNETEAYIFPPKWITWPLNFHNFIDVWEKIPFGRGIFNSLYITTLVTVGTLFFCSLAAYAFAKINFKGRDFLFVIFIATMMVPAQVMLIPQFVIFQKIGWINSHLTLIVPPMISNGFGVFLLRQFFKSIPDALIEAATIDGCNPFGVYWKVMLPQIKPALASLGIFTVLANWNNFLSPFIFINEPGKFTLPVVMKYLQGYYTSNWTLLMAAATLALVPVIIVYIFTQRYFIEGITLSGIKG